MAVNASQLLERRDLFEKGGVWKRWDVSCGGFHANEDLGTVH